MKLSLPDTSATAQGSMSAMRCSTWKGWSSPVKSAPTGNTMSPASSAVVYSVGSTVAPAAVLTLTDSTRVRPTL